MDNDRPLTQKEFSSLGGKTRVNKQTPEERSRIAKIGGEALKAKFGPEYYKELNRRSVEARKKKKALKVDEKIMEQTLEVPKTPSFFDKLLSRK